MQRAGAGVEERASFLRDTFNEGNANGKLFGLAQWRYVERLRTASVPPIEQIAISIDNRLSHDRSPVRGRAHPTRNETSKRDLLRLPSFSRGSSRGFVTREFVARLIPRPSFASVE